jgi:hypothetical protein
MAEGRPAGKEARVELTESVARARAVELAHAKFANTTLRDAQGKVVPPPLLVPEMFRARRKDGRWQMSFGGPAGAWAEVSLDLDGGPESVEVGFASD